jgi:hypothetical protein
MPRTFASKFENVQWFGNKTLFAYADDKLAIAPGVKLSAYITLNRLTPNDL